MINEFSKPLSILMNGINYNHFNRRIMKNLLMAFAVMAFILTSCGSKQQKTTGEHTHADGTTHDCSTHERADVKQESFEVTADSTATKTNCQSEEGCSGACGGCEHAN